MNVDVTTRLMAEVEDRLDLKASPPWSAPGNRIWTAHPPVRRTESVERLARQRLLGITSEDAPEPSPTVSSNWPEPSLRAAAEVPAGPTLNAPVLQPGHLGLDTHRAEPGAALVQWAAPFMTWLRRQGMNTVTGRLQ